MRHHAGKFAFIVCRHNHPAVDKHGTSRKRKGVKVSRIYNLESVSEFGMLELWRDRRHEPITDGADIFLYFAISDYLHLLLDFSGSLASQLNVVINAVTVFWRRDLGLCKTHYWGNKQSHGCKG